MTKIKIQVACLPQCEPEIKALFWNILTDYCTRFSVITLEGSFNVNICFIEYDEMSPQAGATFWAEDQRKIHIQLRDPYLNEWEDNPYTKGVFMATLCHEIVHACQHLTGRNGFKVPHMEEDPECSRDEYYFDPMEVEARVLADYYSEKYTSDLI